MRTRIQIRFDCIDSFNSFIFIIYEGNSEECVFSFWMTVTQQHCCIHYVIYIDNYKYKYGHKYRYKYEHKYEYKYEHKYINTKINANI